MAWAKIRISSIKEVRDAAESVRKGLQLTLGHIIIGLEKPKSRFGVGLILDRQLASSIALYTIGISLNLKVDIVIRSLSNSNIVKTTSIRFL